MVRLRSASVDISPSPMTSPRLNRKSVAALALASLVVVTSVSTLNFGFVADDYQQLLHNSAVAHVSLARLWTTGTWQLLGVQGVPYFRPLQLSLFAVEYAFFGASAAGYHSVQMLLFLLVVLAWYRFFLATTKSLEQSVTAVAIMTAHPAMAPAIAWISCSADLLVLGFSALALSAWLNGARRARLGWLWWLLALLAKEWAVVLPAIVAIYGFFGEGWKSKPRQAVRQMWPVLPVGLAWAVYHIAVTGIKSAPAPERLGSRLWPIVGSLVERYVAVALMVKRPPLWETFWPAAYDVRRDAVIGVFCVLTMVSLVAYLWRRGDSLICASIIAGGWAFLPALFITLIPWPIVFNSRYLVFVVPFVSLATAVAISHFLQPRIATWIAVGFVLACLFAQFPELSTWHDQRRFFEEAVKRSPESPAAIGELARLRSREVRHGDREQMAAALMGFEKTITLTRNQTRRDLVWIRIDAETDYAELLGWMGDWPAALRVLEAEPEKTSAWLNLYLARAYERSGRLLDAEHILQRGLAAAPHDTVMQAELAFLLIQQRRCSEADAQLTQLPITIDARSLATTVARMFQRVCLGTGGASHPYNLNAPSTHSTF